MLSKALPAAQSLSPQTEQTPNGDFSGLCFQLTQLTHLKWQLRLIYSETQAHKGNMD